MTLRIDGPDIGERIGELTIRTGTGDGITLAGLPGVTLVVIMFRGYW